jgi:hypothetical protein
MEGFWYYASENGSVGPLTIAELEAALSNLPTPHRALVWHSSLDSWREAEAVPDLLAVLPRSGAGSSLSDTGSPKGQAPNNTQGRANRRTVGGGLVTTLVLVSALTIARNVTISGPTPAKPDMTSPISGAAREAFTKTGMDTCLRKQESDADTKALMLSREVLSGYCSCYMNELANKTIVGDLNNSRDGTLSSEMKKRMEMASSTCWESLQKKLMGG